MAKVYRRKAEEEIRIHHDGEVLNIRVNRISLGSVSIAIDGPRSFIIDRGEVVDRLKSGVVACFVNTATGGNECWKQGTIKDVHYADSVRTYDVELTNGERLQGVSSIRIKVLKEKQDSEGVDVPYRA